MRNEKERRRYADAKIAYAALMMFYPFTLEDLPSEECRPIPDWEDYHESNYGRTKSFKKGKVMIMRPKLQTDGYLFVTLRKANKQKNFRISRLVATCFVPNLEEKPEVNHIDGHPLNNHVSNLEWATSLENRQHAVHMGFIKSGEDNYQAKLTNEQVIYIRNNPNGLTQQQLADEFCLPFQRISKIQLGKIYRNAGGIIHECKLQRVPDVIREQIRAEYVFGSREFGLSALAKKYHVDSKTIWYIVNKG
ncbi:MAG: NUMOD4 motif-containing HNH endonuclease [Selenomonadaceae bacterium]|nr:NUMOD4 motif-containing HNH endonuclease [Selenomonadaceae bacterium]